MSKSWVVVDVGYIECSELTTIISIETSYESARVSLLRYHDLISKMEIKRQSSSKSDDYFDYFSEGHHRVEIFEYKPSYSSFDIPSSLDQTPLTDTFFAEGYSGFISPPPNM